MWIQNSSLKTNLFSHCAPVLSEPSSERMSADIFSHMDFLFLNVFIGPTSCLYSRNLSIKSLASGSLQKLWAVQITYSIVLICGDFYWQRANQWRAQSVRLLCGYSVYTWNVESWNSNWNRNNFYIFKNIKPETNCILRLFLWALYVIIQLSEC